MTKDCTSPYLASRRRKSIIVRPMTGSSLDRCICPKYGQTYFYICDTCREAVHSLKYSMYTFRNTPFMTIALPKLRSK